MFMTMDHLIFMNTDNYAICRLPAYLEALPEFWRNSLLWCTHCSGLGVAQGLEFI